MKKESLTIQTVAEMVGVSKTTVSRFLNGKYEYMSAETQEAIRSAIEKSHYRPSQVARTLSTKRSNLIAIVCPGVAVQSSHLFLQGVDTAIQNSGYDYIILSCGEDYLRECSALNRCIDQQVDGILFSPVTDNGELITKIAESSIPVVMFDRVIDGWTHSSVSIDHRGMMIAALDHLEKQGYSDIFLFTRKFKAPNTRYIRKEAFCEYMSSHFRKAQKNCVVYLDKGDELYPSICRALQQIRAEHAGKPAVVFAADMITLHAVLRAARALAIRIPEDLRVIGYDQQSSAGLCSPSITYLEQPLYELGQTAVRLLVNCIEHKGAADQTVVLKGKLVIGESTSIR